jgi:hypothetical protein
LLTDAPLAVVKKRPTVSFGPALVKAAATGYDAAHIEAKEDATHGSDP